MDLAAIRRRYVRTWATVDVVAATPYDVLAVIVGDHWIGRLQAWPDHALLTRVRDNSPTSS